MIHESPVYLQNVTCYYCEYRKVSAVMRMMRSRKKLFFLFNCNGGDTLIRVSLPVGSKSVRVSTAIKIFFSSLLLATSVRVVPNSV